MEHVGGFEEHGFSFSDSFELKGKRILDDAEEGELFVGHVPELTVNSDIDWVRVGEERRDGWRGENFRLSEHSLAEMLENRQGRFFIRVFNDKGKRQESGEFRYLRDLQEILLNGERYSENTLLIPSSEGHSPANIRFVGVDGAVIAPNLLKGVKHVDMRQDNLVIAPHPDGDHMPCTLRSASGSVDIVLDLPRVWWLLERKGLGFGEWRDTPLVMTREEFRGEAFSDAVVRLRLPRRIRSVRAGFDDNRDQVYGSRTRDGTAIPLINFVDYSQIDKRLREDASFNIQCEDSVLTLIRVSADPLPAIVSFTCVPAVVSAGEKAVLSWETRNAETSGVSISPEIGVVEPCGDLEFTVSKITTYTLRLAVSGMDDVVKSVTVNFLPEPEEKPSAFVRRKGGGYRRGKGFSVGERLASGLRATDVSSRSIRIDNRRRSVHEKNIDTIRELFNA